MGEKMVGNKTRGEFVARTQEPLMYPKWSSPSRWWQNNRYKLLENPGKYSSEAITMFLTSVLVIPFLGIVSKKMCFLKDEMSDIH